MDLNKFYFTQYSLKAFFDCPLKFKKRYIENIRWGGLPDAQADIQMQMGRDFHLMVQRYFLGIEADYEGYNLIDDKLYRWFNNFKRAFPKDEAVVYLPEYKLRYSTEDLNLEANFDLIAVKNGKVTIWDWKTGANSMGATGTVRGKKLRSSFQTLIYMYVMKELSYLVTDRKVNSENIKMCYWQPEPAEVLAEIVYSDELHKSFYDTIKDKIDIIKNYYYNSFDKALSEKHCKYCEFNSFCNGGKVEYALVNDADE